MEDKQSGKFIAAHLSRRGGQNIKHIIHGVAKDGSTKGDGEADSPEGEHGEEAIKEHSNACEQDCWNEDAGAAGTHKQRVNKAGGETLDFVANDLREEAGHFLQEIDGSTAFPGSEADKEDEANEETTDRTQNEPEGGAHLYAQKGDDRHDEKGGHEVKSFVHRDSR